MQQAFIKNITVIQQAMAEKKLVIFAGSGVSIDSGAPTWEQLVNAMKTEINIPENEHDYLKIMQMYYNDRQRKEYTDKVRALFRHKTLQYNPIHKALFKLDPQHIITTNFDDLLEQVIMDKAYPFSVIKKDDEFPYAANTKLLVKMHGDLEEGNMVLKERDYLEYYRTHTLIEGFLKGIFSTRLVLFVGYSFSDVNLKMVVQSVRHILGNNFQNAYLLSTEPNFHPSKRDYLKENGITVIHYEDAGQVYDSPYIQQYLQVGRNAYDEVYIEEPKQLSVEGKQLFQLITFIEHYAAFEERLKQMPVPDQLFQSVERFRDVRSLPPKFLANLYPFNSRKYYSHNYSHHVLGTNNPTVENFLFNDVDPESMAIKDEWFINNYISQAAIPEYQQKWAELLRTLNLSHVGGFGKRRDILDQFDSPKDLDPILRIKLDNKFCPCLSCAFSTFRIKEFITRINTQLITETSDVQEDMQLAYSQYKAGNFRTAFNQFEETAAKAWRLGRYFIYFIAKMNQTYLRNPIVYDFEDTDNEGKRIILKKIEDVDLDRLKLELPGFTTTHLQLINHLNNDDLLVAAERKLDEYLGRLQKVEKIYLDNGYSHGPYYPTMIMEQLSLIFFFYTHNFIVRDGFSDFLKVFQKGIDGLFLCHRIKEDYPERLQEFNFWMIKYILLYADEQQLYSSLQPIKKRIKIVDSDFHSSLDLLCNLVDSIVHESNFLGRSVEMDREISKQTLNFSFKQTLQHQLARAFNVFGHIEVSNEVAPGLASKLIDFFNVEQVLDHRYLKYVIVYLENIIQYFTYEQCLELLDTSTKKGNYFTEQEFYQLISKRLKDLGADGVIDSAELMKAIIYRSRYKNNSDYNGFTYLWPVSSPENKELIRQTLHDELTSRFDLANFLNSCYIGIFRFADFSVPCIQRMEEKMPSSFTIKNDIYHPHDYTLVNVIDYIYYEGIENNIHTYPKYGEYPAYCQFFLKPLDFDYSRFEAQWLLLSRRSSVHRQLSDIPAVRKALNNELAKGHQSKLSEIFTKYYLKTDIL